MKPVNAYFAKALNYLILLSFALQPSLSLAKITSSNTQRPFLSSIPAIYLKPSNYEATEATLTLFPERASKIPSPAFNRLVYTYALQADPNAPTVFLIPGLGGIAVNGTTLYLAEMIYHQGYSVITLPSSTHWSFALAASKTGKTGNLINDSKDMYKLMSVIKMTLERNYELKPKKWGLVGYSYGGLDTAFALGQDLRLKTFGFDFLVMINPPLNRAEAIHKIDQYYAQGDQWSQTHRQTLVDFVTGRTAEITKGKRSVDTYEKLVDAFPFSETELSWLMAAEFRRAILNSAYVGKVLAGNRPSSIETAFSGKLADYLADTLNPSSELFTVLEQQKTPHLHDKKIVLFHSANDFLSFPEGTSAMSQLTMETRLYPFGGHMGSINHPSFIKDFTSTLQKLQ